MKNSVIAATLFASLFGASVAQANAFFPPVAQTIIGLHSAAEFHTSEKDTFTSSEGQEVTFHLPRDKADSRVLVLDTAWNLIPLVNLTNKSAITNAANEYINVKGLNVDLHNAKAFYLNGSYGYVFDVTAVGEVPSEKMTKTDYTQNAEILNCHIDQNKIENRIKCNQRFGG